MAYGYDASLVERLMPRIRQWETTMGRKMPATMYESMMRGAFGAEADKGTKERALDLQAQSLSDQQQAQRDAASAAKTKGWVDAASTAGMGYLTYKSVTKPSAMSEYLAAQKAGTVPTGVTEPAFTGGQAAVGGGPPAVGAQTGPPASYGTEGFVPPDTGGAGAGGYTPTGSTAGDIGVGVAAGAATNYAVTQTGPGIKSNRTVANLSRKFGMTNLSDKEYADKGSATIGGLAGGGPWGAAIGATVYDIMNIAKGGKISNELLGIPFADRFLNTNPSSILDTVICTELVRQRRITEREKMLCTVFRFRSIPDDMFMAYLEWAEPIVRLMRTNSIANFFLVPFAMHFVGYMLAVQSKTEPTLTERIVWKFSWWRCERIARRIEQSVLEVA